MRTINKIGRGAWLALLVSELAIELLFTGCGMPGVPMPPSLKLPNPVTDLSASRTGNQVTLTWTMPKKNTDKLLLKDSIPVRLWRREDAGACTPVAANLQFAPGADAVFMETLPEALTAGAPRPLTYFVELRNRNGRSAGLSNAAVVPAGEAPAPVLGLAAQVRKDGVILRWTPGAPAAQDHLAGDPAVHSAVRLRRKLLTPPSAAKTKHEPGIVAPPPEPLEQDLMVDSDGQTGQASREDREPYRAVDRVVERALDKEVRFGQVYEYRAQRIVRITAGNQTLELAGEFSAPLRVEVLDIFPPAVPTGLAAVSTAADAGPERSSSEPSIDLSWQPVTDADLAGYRVYRREDDGAWQRISPAQPLVGPAFRDDHIQPGHAYRYAVSAVDQGGHESARSAEAEETVPSP
jgi:hypothetical protein